MKNPGYPVRLSLVLFGAILVCLLPSLSSAASGEMLYEKSTADLSGEVVDFLTARERDMIYGQSGNRGADQRKEEQKDGLNVVLLFDVSKSAVKRSAQTGMPMKRIKDEVVALVDALSPATRFNVVQFTRNYLPFKQGLVRADAANKNLFRTWVAEKWNDSGTLSSNLDGATRNPEGILGLLEFVGEMKPDVIYIVGDGSFERGESGQREPVEWDAVSKAVDAMSGDGKKVALSFIAFAPDEADARQMKKLAKSSGGRFSVMGKKSG